MRWTALLLLLVLLGLAPAARAEEPVRVLAAGSLRAAFSELAQAFTAATGRPVAAQFGASGLLRQRLEQGEAAEIFASADLGNARALQTAGRAGPVVLFARNRLCAVTRPGLTTTTPQLLATMLDPAVKLATSTPRNDPAGDYAWEVFRKADAVQPGSRAALEAKALQLVGNDQAPSPPAGKGAYAWNLAEGRADLFLTYCTGGRGVVQELPGAAMVELPRELATGADYGVTALAAGDPARALAFLAYLLSADGQALLARHGFDAPLVPAAP